MFMIPLRHFATSSLRRSDGGGLRTRQRRQAQFDRTE
jgi:hypothetical protein